MHCSVKATARGYVRDGAFAMNGRNQASEGQEKLPLYAVCLFVKVRR
jgi:hypothetical protein